MTKLPDQRTAAFSNFRKQPASQQLALSSSYRVTRESFIPSAQLLFVHVPNTYPFHRSLSRKLHECLCTKLQLAKKLPFSPPSVHLALELPLGETSNVHLHAPFSIYSILFSLGLHAISDVAVDAVYVETFVPVARCWYASIYHDEETRRNGCRGVSNKWKRDRARCVSKEASLAPGA